MNRLDVMEWAGAGSVATAAAMYDIRLGILTWGVWLIWTANAAALIALLGRKDTGADDDTDTE